MIEFIDVYSISDDNPKSWHFGNGWTDNIKQAHELQIIQAGTDHKWWTSARLLLGLSEDEARQLHWRLNNEYIYTYHVDMETGKKTDTVKKTSKVYPQKTIAYIDKLTNQGVMDGR